MHPNGKDITGFKIGKITVIEQDFSRKGVFWRYKCECGKMSCAAGIDIRAGRVQSCGCSRIGKFRRKTSTAGKTYAEIGRGPSPLRGKTYEQLGRRPSPMKGFKHSLESIQRQREALIQLILEGRANPQDSYNKCRSKLITTTKAGEIRCHSSWEAAYANYLDTDPSVLSFVKDKIRIPYFDGIKKRVYITDFFVELVSGEKLLVEVKPKELLLDDVIPLKTEAAKQWCASNGAKFIFVCQDEIKRINGGQLPDSFREQELRERIVQSQTN